MGDSEKCPVCAVNVKEDQGVVCDGCGAVTCGQRHLKRHTFSEGGCLPFRVEKNAERGRHFIATRDIKALEVVLEDWSLIAGPATKSRPVCLECLNILSRDESVDCQGCGFPMCNNTKCLKGKTHARECKQLSKLGGDLKLDWESNNNVVYAAILPLRAYNLKLDGRDKWEEVDTLLTGDTSDIREGFGEEVLEIIRRVIDNDEEAIFEAINIMGIRRTNATAMGVMETKQGNLLFAVYSLMNAHCYCNTFYSLIPDDSQEADGAFKMLVNAQVDIAKGEEITTRYVCSFDCLPGRQNKIWMNWKFLCRCKRCSSPNDLGTYFSSLRCRACKDGYLVPLNTAMLNPPWRCEECGDKVGPRHVAERLAKYELVMKHDFFTNKEDLQNYLLREMHPNHFLMCTLLQKKLFIRDHFNHKDEKSLEEMIAIGEKLLSIVTTIDPGYTQRRGRILKVLAKDRMMLAKLRKENCVGSEDDFRSAVMVAREDCKTMALCFMYA